MVPYWRGVKKKNLVSWRYGHWPEHTTLNIISKQKIQISRRWVRSIYTAALNSMSPRISQTISYTLLHTHYIFHTTSTYSCLRARCIIHFTWLAYLVTGEDTGTPEENPNRCKENIQTPCREDRGKDLTPSHSCDEMTVITTQPLWSWRQANTKSVTLVVAPRGPWRASRVSLHKKLWMSY